MKRRSRAKPDRIYLVEWRRNQGPYYGFEDSRHDYLYDEVLAASGANSASRALDFGCGSGDFLARWLTPQVQFACGFDIDREGVELARKQCAGAGNVEVLQDLGALPRDFDLGFLNAVWMTLPDEASCIEVLSTVRRHIRPGGRLVAAVTHPCFRDISSPSRRTTMDRAQYAVSPQPFRVTLRGSNTDDTISFIDYHWTLTDLSRQLYASGWSNARFIEVAGPHGPVAPTWLLILAENR